MELKVDGSEVYAATGGRPFDPAKPVVDLPARRRAGSHQLAAAGALVRLARLFRAGVDLPGHGRSEGPALASVADMAAWVGRAAGCGRRSRRRRWSATPWAAPSRSRRRPRSGRASRASPCSAPLPPCRSSADLLAAAREAPERAYQMMTAWAHGHAAKLGGNPVPGLWMTGGTLALFARNAPGVLHADLAACNAWRPGPRPPARCAARTGLIAANDIMTPAKNGAAACRTDRRQPHRDGPDAATC